MRLVVAFIKPQMLNDVIFALHEIEGFSGASVSEGRGFGKWRMNQPPEAIQRAPSNFLPHVRLEIVCADRLADTIAKTICDGGRTGSTSDGLVYVHAVDRQISIRTGAED